MPDFAIVKAQNPAPEIAEKKTSNPILMKQHSPQARLRTSRFEIGCITNRTNQRPRGLPFAGESESRPEAPGLFRSRRPQLQLASECPQCIRMQPRYGDCYPTQSGRTSGPRENPAASVSCSVLRRAIRLSLFPSLPPSFPPSPLCDSECESL